MIISSLSLQSTSKSEPKQDERGEAGLKEEDQKDNARSFILLKLNIGKDQENRTEKLFNLTRQKFDFLMLDYRTIPSLFILRVVSVLILWLESIVLIL